MNRKTTVEDLAIFGGKEAFSRKLSVGSPNIGDSARFLERVRDALDRRWLTNAGPYVEKFERRVNELTGVKHCVAMCNGTVALEIAVRALGLGGEVIIPSFTFVATAHSLQWQEITPVFCDIDPKTHNIDPLKIESLITPRTTGIIGVHLWGRPCDIEALRQIADRHNLKLLFDAAHAFGSSFRGRMIGGFGEAEVFSFHATKFINTLEGGAILTNNDYLAGKIRLMKNFGFTYYDRVEYIGVNGKMNEISAAMGLTALESMEDFIAANRRNYKAYMDELEGIRGLKVMSYDESERCNYQYVVVEVDERETHVSRDQLVDILHTENVLARRYFYPGCHRMEPYRSFFPHAGLLLPETERLAERVLCLPTGSSIGPDEIVNLCQIIRLVIENGVDIRQMLRSSAESRESSKVVGEATR